MRGRADDNVLRSTGIESMSEDRSAIKYFIVNDSRKKAGCLIGEIRRSRVPYQEIFLLCGNPTTYRCMMSTEQYPKIYLYRRIVQAKLFIDAHYAEAIDLDNIAGEACFSKFHFIRQFRKIYGSTPHRYLISVRINKAMQLLRADTPVSDTCYAVGFESLSSFSGLFKKLVGTTPSSYLLQQQQLKALMLSAPLKFIPGCHVQKQPAAKEQF